MDLLSSRVEDFENPEDDSMAYRGGIRWVQCSVESLPGGKGGKDAGRTFFDFLSLLRCFWCLSSSDSSAGNSA